MKLEFPIPASGAGRTGFRTSDGRWGAGRGFLLLEAYIGHWIFPPGKLTVVARPEIG